MYDLETLLHAVYKDDLDRIPHRLLALDPGNDTGWALFVDGKLTEWGQSDTCEDTGGSCGVSCQIFWKELPALFDKTRPTQVIMENYRVYSHKLERHTFSEVPTLRLIGGIDFLCWLQGIPIYYQMATQHKSFVSDAKLKSWGLWKEGMRHSRDAIRAGIYFLMISNVKAQK